MSTQGKVKKNAGTNPREAGEIVVPLHAEEIAVSKRRVAKGKVRVSRITRESETVVSEMLAQEHVEVEKVPIGRIVDSKPAVREEGDTIIIPVVVETLVIKRQLVLKEEIRIRRIRSEEQHQERVMLRKQEAVITRLPPEKSIERSTEKSTAAGKTGG